MKTKLGISFGLAGAALFFLYVFGSTLILVGLALYVLTQEENPWLKHCALKAVALACFFTMIQTLVGLIPSGFSLLNNTLGFLSMSTIDTGKMYSLTQFCINLVDFVQKILFILMGFKALNLQTIAIAPIDNLLAKHFVVES